MVFKVKARYYVFTELRNAAHPQQAFLKGMRENAKATLTRV